MKKVILVLCCAFAFSFASKAQIQFGVKGGINYNSESIQEVSEDVIEGADSRTGYHAGIWLRGKLPILGLYIRPELIYTNLESDATVSLPNSSQIATTYSLQKIDLPILIGKKIFGFGNIFVGPSFQYILDADFAFSEVPDVETDDITVGLQFGAGVEFGRIGIDVRYERGFSDVESRFVGQSGLDNFDTRVNQIIIGLSLKI
ncbi:porin family protein [uncultured Polaribacter sp.]|uniref:porin family protein n=1 Tax=uncultured Polaribacter sp. TaxID=174711 RepID=UPI00261157E5|nr:porin family protein [uncultured Polaribacter sp.]